MPRGDGTGPMGSGPMTGRGLGYCAGYPAAGNMNPAGGRGYSGRGRGSGGRGAGRGRRNRYYATGIPGWSRSAMGMPAFGQGFYQDYPYVSELTPKDEVNILKNQSKALKRQLEDIQGRIDALEKAEGMDSE